MKWAVILLCLLGVAAALCAAFLVNALRIPTTVVTPATQPVADEEKVQVLCATTGIPAMTVIDAGNVTIKMYPKNLVPKNYIASPGEVVGKVITASVVEGQPFVAANFAENSVTPRQVADAIPKGKRAVGISVTDYSGLEGMLFPGSTVDVMASFKPEGSDWSEAVTATLLENIQVLGIEKQTVVSQGKTLSDDSSINRGSTRRVTLLVDTQQAKKLQLAMQHGTLSLALRNPLDTGHADNASVSVRRLLTDLAPFGIEIPIAKNPADPFANGAPTTRPAEPAGPQWQVTVIRGEVTETKSFPMPKAAPVEPEMSLGGR